MDIAYRSLTEDFNDQVEPTRDWMKCLASNCSEGSISGPIIDRYKLAPELTHSYLFPFGIEKFAHQHYYWLSCKWTGYGCMDRTNRLRERLLLMAKARARYQSGSFSEDNAQIMALINFLNKAKNNGVLVILFFAQEERRQLKKIKNIEYDNVRRSLSDFLATFEDSHFKFVEAYQSINSSHYIDYLHLNAEGYEHLAQAIKPYL